MVTQHRKIAGYEDLDEIAEEMVQQEHEAQERFIRIYREQKELAQTTERPSDVHYGELEYDNRGIRKGIGRSPSFSDNSICRLLADSRRGHQRDH